MGERFSSRWGAVVLAAVCFSASSMAYANKDVFYPHNASATVNGGTAGVNNTMSAGTDGATTLGSAVHFGENVSVTITWHILDRSTQGNANKVTDYSGGLAASFSTTTTQKPASGSDVSTASISNCSITSYETICSTVLSFSVPEVIGNYQLKVTPGNLGGDEGLPAKSWVLNFSIAEAALQKHDTHLSVAKQCVVLHQSTALLTARLKEVPSQSAVSGAGVEFYLDPAPSEQVEPITFIGNATTDADGVATLSYNVSALPVGDYGLYAEYAGNSAYNSINASNFLGVSYVFAGFRQPINAEGNSIFGGRIIPIKIKLQDANGVPVSDAQPTVWLTTYSAQGLGEVLEQVSSVSAADTGNMMRYSPEEQQYIYNWDASNIPNGTYAVVVDLGDSAACRTSHPYAMITVAKKSKK